MGTTACTGPSATAGSIGPIARLWSLAVIMTHGPVDDVGFRPRPSRPRPSHPDRGPAGSTPAPPNPAHGDARAHSRGPSSRPPRALLVAQPFPHPLRGMPLLTRRALISDQPRVDQLAIRPQRRRRARHRTLALRRRRRTQRLAHRPPVHPVTARQRPDRQSLTIVIPTNLLEQLHSGTHPFCDLRSVLEKARTVASHSDGSGAKSGRRSHGTAVADFVPALPLRRAKAEAEHAGKRPSAFVRRSRRMRVATGCSLLDVAGVITVASVGSPRRGSRYAAVRARRASEPRWRRDPQARLYQHRPCLRSTGGCRAIRPTEARGAALACGRRDQARSSISRGCGVEAGEDRARRRAARRAVRRASRSSRSVQCRRWAGLLELVVLDGQDLVDAVEIAICEPVSTIMIFVCSPSSGLTARRVARS